MIKKTITFEDFNGETRTENFYFHMSEAELLEMEASMKGGLSTFATAIANSDNSEELIKLFKKLVLIAYGVKSDDGRRFIKNDDIRQEFTETNAYSQLFMELATNSEKALEFFNGVIPKDLGKKVEKLSSKNLKTS